MSLQVSKSLEILSVQASRVLLALDKQALMSSDLRRVSDVSPSTLIFVKRDLSSRGLIIITKKKVIKDDSIRCFIEVSLTDKGKLVVKELKYISELIS